MRFAWVAFVVACSSSSSPLEAQTGEPLVKGTPIEKEISVNNKHRYRVKLGANEVLLATVEQRGIDVVVKTFDRAGTQLAEIDSPNGTKGPEPVVIRSREAGEYAFEVAPLLIPEGQPILNESFGRYGVRIDEILPAAVYEERRMQQTIDSPRLFALWKAVRDRDPKALRSFWTSLPGKTPIVEEIADDPTMRYVTFVVRAPATTSYVGMFGGPTWHEKPLANLPGTDVWYLTARMPRDSRTGYAFIKGGPPPSYEAPFRYRGEAVDPRYRDKQLDAFNPRPFFDLSLLEITPPKQPWADDQPAMAGDRKTLSIESKELGETRLVRVYTPPGFDPKQQYPLVVAFDGEAYGMDPTAQLIPLPRILDNLIAAKKIPPTVAAIVANQGTRSRDLTASPAFAKFVATELVPKLRADFNAGLTPDKTVVTGSSYGGLCSAFIGLKHSDVVGNVLSNSGAFGYRVGEAEKALSPHLEPGYLIREYVASPKLPIRFYLDAGLFESGGPWSLLNDNRRMRDVLEAKGYSVKYAEYSGGHEYMWWRGTIADGLIALLN